MIILPSAAQIHLARESRRLTVCGAIEKNDGTFIRCTQHDEDLEISGSDLGGVYHSVLSITASDTKSGSDLAVDNMEITGYTDNISFGFNVADIEAGLLANAAFETFLCQWDDPDAWQKVISRGFLGEIRRTAEGQFTAEWRGLLQPLQQNIGRTLGERCDVVRFGDARCKLNVDALSLVGTITGVTTDRRFEIEIDAPSSAEGSDYFTLGEASWESGQNSGYDRRQIKRDVVLSGTRTIDLWETMPNAIEVGDLVRLRPGCNRTDTACKGWDNFINFRGHGLFIPGIPAIIRAP